LRLTVSTSYLLPAVSYQNASGLESTKDFNVMVQLGTAGALIKTGKKYAEHAKEEAHPSVSKTVG